MLSRDKSFESFNNWTGFHLAGACTRLELEMDRPLLWCACRHHVYELVAKAVWKATFPGESVCPGEKILKDVGEWSKKTNFRRDFTAADRPALGGGNVDLADCIADFHQLSEACRKQGKSSFQRGDYEELMELMEVKYAIHF